MSSHLINLGDTSIWPQYGTHGIYTIQIPTSTTGGNIIYVIYDEIYPPPVINYRKRIDDPKLHRQYNLARAKNNKSEMRRLEKLIANNKQG